MSDGVNIDQAKINEAIRRGTANGLLGIQLQMSRKLRADLSKPGTGRIYRVARGRPGGRNLRARGLHRASAPGQPPAVDTGRLRQSWAIAGNADQMFRNRAPLGAKATSSGQQMAVLAFDIRPESLRFTYGSNLKYARALEFGMRSRGLSPRPYVRPMIAAVAPRALRIVQGFIKKEFGGR